MMRIVHVVERFGGTGPERSLIAAAKYAARADLHQEHVVCTLSKAASPITLALARQSGVHVMLQPDRITLHRMLTDADIVQVHFWNTPDLYAFLRSNLPAMRLLIWAKILGSHGPQVLTRPLVEFADCFVVTSPGSLELPALNGRHEAAPAAGLYLIPGIADFERLEGFTPRPHAGFNVGYIGVVNYSKLHPDYVAMSAAVSVPDVRFIVCGIGGHERLEQQARTAGVRDRFEFRGYVEAIRGVLEICDLFGYPLCHETYATSEKALQEAMWVGVPPVVFPHGGVRYLVEDGMTGRVVHSPQEYVRAIERLYREPEERRRLGANARSFARDAFDPRRAVHQFSAIYDALMQQPKRERTWPADGTRPAQWFVAALGDQAGPFAVSLQGGPQTTLAAAEAEIAEAADLLFSGEGGIVHYRNRYPEDPYLHRWTGLVLAKRGDHQRAEQEFEAAAKLGVVV